MMDHGDPSLWRRLPEPGDAVPEEQAGGGRPRSRHRGLRQVRRLSGLTAAGLVTATAVAAGYFAHASTSASAGTSPQPVTPVSGSHSKAPASSSSQACTTAVTTAVTAPVAVSGGSGVTTTVPRQPAPAPRQTTVPGQTAVPGQKCAPGPGTGAPPPVAYQEPHENERGDS